MDELPEEILIQIISHIGQQDDNAPPGLRPCPDTMTLYALGLTSRKLSRIARPYLYTSIHSHSGTMGKNLLRTLLADVEEDLRKHVRRLAFKHTTEGCLEVDEQVGIGDAGYGSVFDACEPLMLDTITLLPNLIMLDLSRLAPLAREAPVWLSALEIACTAGQSNWQVSTGFGNVKRMTLHLGAMGGKELWSVFRLPNLRELELDVRKPAYLRHRHQLALVKYWQAGTSNIETLRIVGLKSECLSRLHDLSSMSRACKALRTFFLSMENLYMAKNIARQLENHVLSATLTGLQFAVVGLWHYDVELVGVDDHVDLDELGKQMVMMLLHATGTYGAEDEEKAGGEHLRLTGMRELTEVEKEAYDLRLARRP
jgi:hypothetical protein